MISFADYIPVADIRKCRDCGQIEVWTISLDKEDYIKVCSRCGDGPFGSKGYLEAVREASVMTF